MASQVPSPAATSEVHLCPFGHADTEKVDEIPAGDLIIAYRKYLATSIEDELRGVQMISFRRCNVCLLAFFTPMTPGSEHLYAQLSRSPGYYSAKKDEFRYAARRITPASRVLGIGCGTGAFAAYLGSTCNYTGIEMNQQAAEIARSNGLNISSDDLHEIAQCQPGAFDVVCAFQVLEHVTDPARFLSSCAACLKPGGLVLLGVPNADAYLGTQPDEILNMPPHHLTWWGADTFWKIAPILGLEIIAIEPMPLKDCWNICRIAFLNAIRRRCGSKGLFFFDGLLYKFLNRIARIGARLTVRALYDKHLLPQGHSMLAVLRKP